MLGASGVVEAAVTVLAMLRGVLPPTHNLDEPDPACDLDHVRTARPSTVDHALSNSFGFGGHNVSLVLSRPRSGRARPATPTPRPATIVDPERDASR